MGRAIKALFVVGVLYLAGGAALYARGAPKQVLRQEIYKGKDAIAYMANKPHLKAARAKEAEKLRGMGFVPSPENSVVIRAYHVPANLPASIALLEHLYPAALAQSADAITSDGEAYVESWDDGDPSTWEGTVYFERYSDGRWIYADGQMPADETDTIYWGDPIQWQIDRNHAPQQASLVKPEDQPSFVAKAMDMAFPTVHAQTNCNTWPSCSWRAAHWGPWKSCMISTHTGSILGCVFSGAAYLPCLVGTSVADTLGCTLAEIF